MSRTRYTSHFWKAAISALRESRNSLQNEFCQVSFKNTLPFVTMLHLKIKKKITSAESVIFLFPKFDSELAQANQSKSCVLITHVMCIQPAQLLVAVTALSNKQHFLLDISMSNDKALTSFPFQLPQYMCRIFKHVNV